MKSYTNRRRVISFAVCLTLLVTLFWWNNSEASLVAEKTITGLAPFKLNLSFQAQWEKRMQLKGGETFELSVSLPSPSSLPQHGRIGVRWTLDKADAGESLPAIAGRKEDAFGIYTAPTADWRKVLHALDSDLYLVYRAPVAGLYRLEIAPVTDEANTFAKPESIRWREDGVAPQAVTFPA
nr:hypothetical protein [Acidobacteriota bacterium]